MRSRWFAVGALLAGLGVIIGAFGAHGLRGRIIPEMLVIYETGVRYHMYAAFGVMAAGLAGGLRPDAQVGTPAALLIAGAALFSGSLYALALTGIHWLGIITPFGGLALIAGWIALAVATWK